ncbi:MAG: hypothetical protein D3903_02850 [Candidatus Electrothrix sp. GM3_4]|nr:hypothetical protein [Candidatus Electrothrix sp. GM3_4]
MLHSKNGRPRPVQGPKSNILSYHPVICSHCNNNRSQPWDNAYKFFERWVFDNSDLIYAKRFAPLELVYGEDAWWCQSLNLFKYFVKAFGCRLASAETSVPDDLVDLLDKEYFLTNLRICFSINRVSYTFPEYFESALGIGNLYQINSRSQGTMERYTWCINISWLRIWFFYAHEIPSCVGASWVADSSCLYFGEFDAPSLEEHDQLVKDAEQNGTHEQVVNLKKMRKTLWG